MTWHDNMPSQSVFYLAHPADVRTADQVVSADSIVSHARHPSWVGRNIPAVGEISDNQFLLILSSPE